MIITLPTLSWIATIFHHHFAACLNTIVLHIYKTALYKILKLNNDANLLYTQYCFGVLPINFVLDVRKLCFLSKQRCHSISVHNVFYDIFGFSEFNRLCSVYSVCGQSRGYFIAWVWDVFRDLAFWLLYWLYCFSSGLSVCLSLHFIVWIKITIFTPYGRACSFPTTDTKQANYQASVILCGRY